MIEIINLLRGNELGLEDDEGDLHSQLFIGLFSSSAHGHDIVAIVCDLR